MGRGEARGQPGGRQPEGVQVSPARQQRLQLHTVSPAAQRLTQVPSTQTWPQGQPPGHEAGAQA